MRKRRLLSKLVAMLVGAAIAALLLEVVMIVAEPSWTRGEFIYDPRLGFRMRSHFHGSNEFGFNDRDYPRPKPPGVRRIVVLGDSFCWCAGRDRNYTAVLERAFARERGPGKVDVVNAGYPMTHTGHQRIILERYGLLYEPDLVLLAFYVGNDVADAVPGRRRIVVNNVMMDIDGAEEWRLLGRPIVAQSRLLACMRQTWIALTATDKALPAWEPPTTDLDAAPPEESDPAAFSRDPAALLGYLGRLHEGATRPSFTEDAYLALLRLKGNVLDPEQLTTPVWGIRWATAFTWLDELTTLLAARSIPFAVLLIPDEYQVDDALRTRVLADQPEKLRRFDVRLPQRRLTEWFRARGVPVIDVLDRFRATQPQCALYYPFDTHWNRAGNHLAAVLLHAELAALLPR